MAAETKDPKTAGARSYQHKGFDVAALKSFDEPVRLFSLRWRPRVAEGDEEP